MKKLSLDALKERAEATGNEELMETISGGNENACHDSGTHPLNDHYNQTGARHPLSPFGQAVANWFWNLCN